MASYRNQTRQRVFYKTNQYISAPTVRLVDEQNKQIGLVPIGQARQQARGLGLDLVEIAPKAKPPVVKLISFSKFKYQQAKKLQAEKKTSKNVDIKEIQMKPFISQNDYQTRLKRTKKFLNTGNKVKLSIKFLGRQIIHPEFGHDLVAKFTQDISQVGTPETEAKLIGKRLIITYKPDKKNEKKSSKIQN